MPTVTGGTNMAGQHIYANYHGHEVEIIDSDATEDHRASNVHVQTTDGQRIFVDRFWRGGLGWTYIRCDWKWIPLETLHNVHLSDAESISDIILAETANI